MVNDYHNQIVWVVGASSGIGHALACELHARGAILVLSARRKEDLDKLNEELGGAHKVFPLDVTDADMVLRTAQAICASSGRIDRVIFMAAAYAPMACIALDLAVTRQIIDTNITGAWHIIRAVLPILKNQKAENAQSPRGQIALCGSVAGYIGLPPGQPYSATKAAIVNMAESLHAECSDYCDVRLISPGFVRTPLTQKNTFDMPMMIEPEQAAREIADGLLSRHFEIHFPKKFTYILKFLRILPYGLVLPILRRIKRAADI